MSHYVEIRSYTLKPGTRDEFHKLFLEQAFPMLQRWKVDVVAYGPSLHDSDSYFLMRRYDSLAQREESENAFYGSEEWRQGPREAILALIENYTEVVLEVDEATLQGLRGPAFL
ncbi:MAG TPA: NIPSNAP family protein [Anaerolineales bacterium]|nr:NIPSNAP family protein [Anaerolineales bacterium]